MNAKVVIVDIKFIKIINERQLKKWKMSLLILSFLILQKFSKYAGNWSYIIYYFKSNKVNVNIL